MFCETYKNFDFTKSESIHVKSGILYETRKFSPNYNEKKNFGGSFEILVQFKDLVKMKHNLIW